MTSKDIERFWSRVDRHGGVNACWLWTAGKFPSGYGAIRIGGVQLHANRVAWEITNGRVPRGLCVLHNCPTDPERRVREHNSSKRGSKWARGRRPVDLLCSYYAGENRSQAQREEARVKYLSKKGKQELIREKVGR